MPKPANLEEMLVLATKLSTGFGFVLVESEKRIESSSESESETETEPEVEVESEMRTIGCPPLHLANPNLNVITIAEAQRHDFSFYNTTYEYH